MRFCRYCNEPLEEVTLTDYTNPTRDNPPPIPAYHCKNPLCEMQPYFFKWDPIKPCDKEHRSTDIVRLGALDNRVVRQWCCPWCDNPVEIIDRVYYIWNCPNCAFLSSNGLTFRYYPIKNESETELVWDDEEELVDERSCGTCWNPYLPPDDDEEDDEDD